MMHPGILPYGTRVNTTGRGVPVRLYHATDFFPHLGNGGKWLHFTAGPIRDGTGTVIGAVESFEDVSKRQTLERALALSDKDSIS